VSRAQFVVAVFDDWQALHSVLVDMESRERARSGAVLHARKDIPPQTSALGMLKEMKELHFVHARQHIVCTMGQLAQELSLRSAGGARSIGEALRAWCGADQAGQLENHIEQGRLVLWVELRSSEDYSVVCGMLVQASPHMVGLCSVNFES